MDRMRNNLIDRLSVEIVVFMSDDSALNPQKNKIKTEKIGKN